MVDEFDLNKRTGIDLPNEVLNLTPSPELKKRTNRENPGVERYRHCLRLVWTGLRHHDPNILAANDRGHGQWLASFMCLIS